MASHLNGAYYGPSIPPPSSKSYHRPGRGDSGCGCCGCLGCLCNCCCGCILNLICQILITVVIVLGIAVFLLWLIFRPNLLQFHATDASLTQFNFTSPNNNNLHYNLALNITVRNPNRRIGIYYDVIEVSAFYEDQRFSTVNLSQFYQGHKNTSVLSPSFVGQNIVLLGTDGISSYNSEKSSGIFSIDVKINLRIRFKFGLVKFGHYKPKIRCPLKVPLRSNSTSSSSSSNGVFETTKCSYDL
ncbi:NDR1/HIN1-Like protein 3-like [Cucumis melo var. makuwa]|uniref:NDR1/HIN1-Like protein 3-like n=1 Tax=Cucumis melo var. makuwa TaxID=1194695 RepID=A0A5D3C7J9_CUCMM|nr:NDR1/HIN1-Like protein 3-like [Cucumis melo var. makuwa]